MKTTPIATLACTLTAAVFMAVSGLATAQTTTAKTAKPAAVSKKEAVAKKKPPVSANRTNLKTTAKNVAAGIEAAEAAMTPAELAIAERVHVGSMPCELGASVNLTQDDKAPGYFDMQGKNFKYRMFPVATTTGAIRLEDQKAGAVWLQLANKSMLMNQKLGIRLADECMSPTQVAMAEVLKRNPPPSVLDAPKPAVLPVLLVEPLQPALPAQ
ncbi:hypothetical protein [Polaromonas sp.]|uniref:hypothetical protein n=1 Tax=Polaromonas sp. TaxID=1869339 RepID=UPI001D2EBF81|nr:hypothetical protein [Polaromonas sp.]MBT9475964.1 hypothetical protein [Polaromonas sp.]